MGFTIFVVYLRETSIFEFLEILLSLTIFSGFFVTFGRAGGETTSKGFYFGGLKGLVELIEFDIMEDLGRLVGLGKIVGLGGFIGDKIEAFGGLIGLDIIEGLGGFKGLGKVEGLKGLIGFGKIEDLGGLEGLVKPEGLGVTVIGVV